MHAKPSASSGGGIMDRIFMTVLNHCKTTGMVDLAVFLKGKTGHMEDLMGFLGNQGIQCDVLPHDQRDSMQEFVYFDEGFSARIDPDRWTYSELKNYIQTYTHTWTDDVMVRDTFLEELRTCDESIVFDDRFYVELSRKIDQLEDRYYQESLSISLFLSGILKIMSQNLQLYWAAVRLKDYRANDVMEYLNYYPPTHPQKTIIKACRKTPPKSVLKRSLIFHDEHIADFFIKPGPFSPREAVITKFLDYVFMMIDDFIYGDLNYKRVTYRLNREITELRSQQEKLNMILPERKAKTKEKFHLLLLGATDLSHGIIFSEFQRGGYSKHRVDLRTEYEKFHSFNTNDLRLPGSGYDGILLGPVPHKMRGDFPEGADLIEQMTAHPDQYPLFTVIRNRTGLLKITKTSLRTALKELDNKLQQMEAYG